MSLTAFFPAWAQPLRLYLKLTFFHYPWSEDKPAQLERLRMQMIDDGHAEDTTGESWEQIVMAQHAFDAKRGQKGYAALCKQNAVAALDCLIAGVVRDRIIAHREDKAYNTLYEHACAVAQGTGLETDARVIAILDGVRETEQNLIDHGDRPVDLDF